MDKALVTVVTSDEQDRQCSLVELSCAINWKFGGSSLDSALQPLLGP